MFNNDDDPEVYYVAISQDTIAKIPKHHRIIMLKSALYGALAFVNLNGSAEEIFTKVHSFVDEPLFSIEPSVVAIALLRKLNELIVPEWTNALRAADEIALAVEWIKTHE